MWALLHQIRRPVTAPGRSTKNARRGRYGRAVRIGRIDPARAIGVFCGDARNAKVHMDPIRLRGRVSLDNELGHANVVSLDVGITWLMEENYRPG